MAGRYNVLVALERSPGRGVLLGVVLGIALWACLLAPVAVLLRAG